MVFGRGAKKDRPPRRSGQASRSSLRSYAPNEPREQATRLSSQYRRGATIGGYRSPTAEAGKSSRERTHSLNRLRRRVGAALVLVTMLAILTLVGLWQYAAEVRVVALVDGSRVVEFSAEASQAIQEAVSDYFAKNPVERLRFLLREQDLTAEIMRAAPEISGLVGGQAWGLPSTLTLELSLRRPVAAWQIGERTFYVDADGASFERNYFDTPSVVVIDENDASVSGQSVASGRFLQTIGRLVNDLAEHSYTVEKIIIPRNRVRQVDGY